MPSPSALIAEDEPLLAEALRLELARAWPELRIAATVGDGHGAVQQALDLRPDVLWFDIRMPGQTGLEAALELADAWPLDEAPFPALVFVTAYDQYAVQAFEAQALDYLLKPVEGPRLRKTVQKVQAALAARGRAQAPAPVPQAEAGLQALLERLRGLVPAQSPQNAPPVGAPLTVIQASSGARIHFVPVADVLVFEAADKYVRVLTAAQEYLIRMPLKELAAQLESEVFWQIHRGTLVRATGIESVERDESGRLHLRLRDRPDRLPVSRLHAHRFKAM
ncbi:LytR/AlgR family response regulator transcription factor [Acidovorax sp. NCPPB 4044]|uniref:LytR/AlgR family response regulator transcription factor n=1 Tax=Acidovorax sp. NCPPB 4044 TaxID=2940490 RepID=UPI0023023663|nr:LytTR family DNA-binding domain-containing protein [Acidovorax sp. NCPPB 4044]MDA8521648.1 LytTR family DNA-binding domain-containing protein [Acidovorax sp. NCPPB 4044]